MNKQDNKKRIKPKSIPKLEPKKRETNILKDGKKIDTTSISHKIILPSIEDEIETKQKKSEYKYLKLALNAPQNERRVLGERLQKGEIKITHYAVDGNNGYTYYIELKK